ncbi:NAD(P)-dependent oxidoreductase [Sporosarcina sp.]|uniref:NAD(P)-dependent oxidoreductase n=1 Tax=Sporosarcina sp. TaxID=49982 RepID=UPI00262468F9|nr:NAD(P)-dependent oxidoreductase [Sporosarcina sp.]
MAKKKIMVPFPVFKEGLTELFERYDVYYPSEKVPREEILKILPEYDALISCGFKPDKEAIERMDNIKIMSTYGVGYDNVDIETMNEKGILVCNLPDIVTESTAEFGMALMLSVMRRVAETDRKLRLDPNLPWGPIANVGRGLNGKRLGIVGMGNIGKALARRTSGFMMDVTYHNRNRLSEKVEKEYNATYVPTLEQLLKESDIVMINTPLTSSTYHMFDTPQFEMMKQSAFLINIGRGPVVNEQALIKALQNGVIAGAGLDVFENEPNIPDAFKAMDNVVLGAHMATATIETRTEMVRLAAKNIIDYLEYGKHPNLVNQGALQNVRPLHSNVSVK